MYNKNCYFINQKRRGKSEKFFLKKSDNISKHAIWKIEKNSYVFLKVS